MDCIFCKILNGDIPSSKVYEDDFIFAFRDIEPQAPEHVIIIPKTHIVSANDITPENSVYSTRIFEAVPTIAKLLNIDKGGYRIVNICGKDGGQTVEHLHFHLLGGREFTWPAG